MKLYNKLLQNKYIVSLYLYSNILVIKKIHDNKINNIKKKKYILLLDDSTFNIYFRRNIKF